MADARIEADEVRAEAQAAAAQLQQQRVTCEDLAARLAKAQEGAAAAAAARSGSESDSASSGRNNGPVAEGDAAAASATAAAAEAEAEARWSERCSALEEKAVAGRDELGALREEHEELLICLAEQDHIAQVRAAAVALSRRSLRLHRCPRRSSQALQSQLDELRGGRSPVGMLSTPSPAASPATQPWASKGVALTN